jgi:hypothetical protein
VAGVVDQHVEAALLVDDGLDGRVDRVLRRDVKLDGAQVDVVLGGVVLGCRDRRCVATGAVAHAGVDGVPGVGERPGAERAEATRGAGDDDGLAHGALL